MMALVRANKTTSSVLSMDQSRGPAVWRFFFFDGFDTILMGRETKVPRSRPDSKNTCQYGQ
jgi:hypothetical protein